MNWPTRLAYTTMTGVAFAAAMLGACSRANEPQQAGVAPAPAASALPAQTPPSTPKADSTQTAKASDDAMKPMSKDEESESMPRPSQANDHSTLAKDPQQ